MIRARFRRAVSWLDAWIDEIALVMLVIVGLLFGVALLTDQVFRNDCAAGGGVLVEVHNGDIACVQWRGVP